MKKQDDKRARNTAKCARWRAKNREKVRAYMREYMARRRAEEKTNP